MLAGILEHVEEGVLLLNGTRVRWLNPAARLMFPALEQPVGRPLVEVVREHRIDGLALRARESRLEQAAEVELPISGRSLQVRAVPLHDGDLILEQVWGYNYLGDRKTVDVHIGWLREKLGRFGKLGFEIVTVRGAGYRLDPIRNPAGNRERTAGAAQAS